MNCCIEGGIIGCFRQCRSEIKEIIIQPVILSWILKPVKDHCSKLC